jgi:hypothetical protein
MTKKFKISDRVMYQDIGGKPLVGTIADVTKDESGEPTWYVVKLDNGQIVGCSIDKLAHLDLGEL